MCVRKARLGPPSTLEKYGMHKNHSSFPIEICYFNKTSLVGVKYILPLSTISLDLLIYTS
jgi:hypothetical protein